MKACNKARVHKAVDALRGNSQECFVIELLTNLRHMCYAHGINFDDADATADANFEYDIDPENEVERA